MTIERPDEDLRSLVHELCKLGADTEWVAFKMNISKPREIGEYISALSNSAAVIGKASAYMVWGVSDREHLVIGTSFNPASSKVGNEVLEDWLLRLLQPRIHFRFHRVQMDDKSVVILEIERDCRQPVQFHGQEFIRIGSYNQKLKDFPERARALWRVFDKTPFANRIAAEHVQDQEVLRLLDYPKYFDLLKHPLPSESYGILDALSREKFIQRCDAGGWDITNLGAILFAKDLGDFGSVRRKAIRVILYSGNGRSKPVKEVLYSKGYATDFDVLSTYIWLLLPSREVIEQWTRRTLQDFPEPAVRELVANALIHQNFFITGSGPMVEIFDRRIEVTNPGSPLVDVGRFVDSPPRSRNESLASFMRRIGIGEERGAGWDEIVAQTEHYQLPAPLVVASNDHTRVVLSARRSLEEMDQSERVRAMYLHACLRYVKDDHLTGSTVRQRFGFEDRNRSRELELIEEAIQAGAIRAVDSSDSPKSIRYVPWWAQVDTLMHR